MEQANNHGDAGSGGPHEINVTRNLGDDAAAVLSSEDAAAE